MFGHARYLAGTSTETILQSVCVCRAWDPRPAAICTRIDIPFGHVANTFPLYDPPHANGYGAGAIQSVSPRDGPQRILRATASNPVANECHVTVGKGRSVARVACPRDVVAPLDWLGWPMYRPRRSILRWNGAWQSVTWSEEMGRPEARGPSRGCSRFGWGKRISVCRCLEAHKSDGEPSWVETLESATGLCGGTK